MGRQYGTDRSVFNTLSAPLLDPDGLPIVDTGTGFGSSPLGISLREQIQFGLPNATFNLLPPDPAAAISEGENPLPFWQIQTTPNITATATYDTTTQTWGIKVDPGTAPSGDYIELKTRSWVTTDDNIALRQIASLTASKGGTYAGTTQWNLTLSAAYYDAANAALGTTVIGTVYDNTTWTSISGTTTAGGSAISSSAAWAEFTIKLSTTAAVSSSTFATLKSLLIATSTPASGGGAFVVTETFTSSGTWTRPTGVNNLLAVVGIGAGGGGGGGGLTTSRSAGTTGVNANGGNGGGGGRWAIIRDLYVADAGSVTIGIGAGGTGGTANTGTKAAAATTVFNLVPTAGGNGGATTFGSYLSIPGGSGAGTAGTAGGLPGTTITTSVYDNAQLAAGTGNNNSGGGTAAASAAAAFGYLSFTPIAGSGIAGGTSSVSYTYSAGGTGVVLTGTATAGGSAGYGGGGGLGQNTLASTAPLLSAGKAGVAGAGGGGGAGLHYEARGTISGGTSSAGNGGAGTASHGAGGGGGGAMGLYATTSVRYDASAFTAKSGAGGAGSDGVIYVIYIA